MKLKARLALAFVVIMFAPFLLVYFCVRGVSNYQMRSFSKEHDLTERVSLISVNSIELFNRLTAYTEEGLRKAASDHPELFADRAFLERENETLRQRYAFLVMRQDGAVVFRGDLAGGGGAFAGDSGGADGGGGVAAGDGGGADGGGATVEDSGGVVKGAGSGVGALDGAAGDGGDALASQLPAYGALGAGFRGGFYLGEADEHLAKQIDFLDLSGSKCSVFIVSAVDEFLPEVRSMVGEMAFAGLLVLALTGVVVLVWLYQSIVKPLEQLQVATKKIRDGDLDFALSTESNDEVGLLCQDFEEMRIRLKESAEGQIQYDRDNKELISNISHDLKTPITAIKGYVEGILDGVASSPEKLEKYIRTIYNKANDMDRLIDELTFYSKIDTNKIPYNFAKINVNGYFRDCTEEVGLDLDANNIDLGYFNYVDDDTVIIADAEQIKRAVNNVVANSIKYLDKPRGIINIRVKDEGDFIHVEIEDNGRGIAPKDLPNIFDRFYRADASRNPTQGGSGIGLSIVKKIIEDHGGRIWATSKEGIGTQIHFVMRKYQEVVLDEDPQAADKGGKGDGKKRGILRASGRREEAWDPEGFRVTGRSVGS
ncbi:MAG: HAMP domain-containing histidine kinase [Lachnospiraceae bacterium]|jgi:signal transduction histidine kinase|nr:HAMP domain-containing histidine kinase [Lachnospiraceae bacterium]